MWIPPEEKDPVLAHHPTRQKAGYYGAVRLRDGKFFGQREADIFNADGFWHFLLDLHQAARVSGRKIVVISDKAKWHHARLHQPWREQVAADFALHFLPPYSPELNPIERVWKLVRRLCLHNQYFGHLEDVIAAVEECFARWSRPNQTLLKLCSIL
jgi:transposase